MTDALTVISSMATARILTELASSYGREVALRPMGGVDAARRVRAGEPADVVVLAAGVIAALEREGHLVAGSRVDVARSGISVAVRSGARRPDIADEAGLRRAVEAAARIGFSTGPSGEYLTTLWARWGITDEIAERLVQAPPGVPVGALLARGEVDLGFQQTSELKGVPGIEVVGPLPPEIQLVTVFSAGISRTSPRPEEARAFVAYLASPEAAPVMRECGMEPA